MTILRRDPGHVSNYFNRLYDGCGHRGSSYSDLDAVSHDIRTGRFLIQEFKRNGEACSRGQRRLLEALAQIPNFTVWYVGLIYDDSCIAWSDLRTGEEDFLTPVELRQKFLDWWDKPATEQAGRAAS